MTKVTPDDGKSIADVVYENIYKSLVPQLGISIDVDNKDTWIPVKEIDKLQTSECAVTDQWEELGKYKQFSSRPNKTPKTDLIYKDIHISVKSGVGARLMSGGICETLATIGAAIKNTTGHDDMETKLTELTDYINNNGGTRIKINASCRTILNRLVKAGKLTPEEAGLKKSSKKSNNNSVSADFYRKNEEDESPKPLSKEEEDDAAILRTKAIISEINKLILQTADDLRTAVITEALTGATKFGKDNKAAANHVLVWDAFGICTLYTAAEYVSEYGSHYKIQSVYKSSGKKVKDPLGGKVPSGERSAWIILSIVDVGDHKDTKGK